MEIWDRVRIHMVGIRENILQTGRRRSVQLPSGLWMGF